MVWLYVPGLVASNSDSTLPNLPPELSVGLNGSLAQPRALSALWAKGGWIRRLSGLICEPSLAQPGVDAWISSLPDFPANPFRSPESSAGPTTRGTSGHTSSASSERFDRGVSSSKTYQDSLQPGLPMGDTPTRLLRPGYEEWVTRLRRASSQRQRLARRTAGSGYSFWPTAQSHDAQGPKTAEQIAAMRERTAAGVSNLNEAASMWPTPNTPSGGPNTKSTETHTGGVDLDGAVLNWPTPRGEDSESAGNHPGATDSLTGAAAFSLLDPESEIPGPQSSGSAPTSRRQLTESLIRDLLSGL